MESGKVIAPVAATLLTREASLILVWGVAQASNTEQKYCPIGIGRHPPHGGVIIKAKAPVASKRRGQEAKICAAVATHFEEIALSFLRRRGGHDSVSNDHARLDSNRA
jgi:hypothetical protein